MPVKLIYLIPVAFLGGAAVATVGAYLLLRALFGKELLP